MIQSNVVFSLFEMLNLSVLMIANLFYSLIFIMHSLDHYHIFEFLISLSILIVYSAILSYYMNRILNNLSLLIISKIVLVIMDLNELAIFITIDHVDIFYLPFFCYSIIIIYLF